MVLPCGLNDPCLVGSHINFRGTKGDIMKTEEIVSEKIHFVAWDIADVWSQEDLIEELQYLYTKLYEDYNDKDIKRFIDFRYEDVITLRRKQL